MDLGNNVSSYLNEFIELHTDKLYEILRKVEMERPAFIDIFRTIAYLEANRTGKNVAFVLDKNNHIKESIYSEKYIDITTLNGNAIHVYYPKFEEYSLYRDGRFIESHHKNDLTGVIKEVTMQYKHHKTYLNIDSLETSDDIKLYIAYLFSMRSEVDTTKIGATFYNAKDELIADGYNALSPSFDKNLRYLINISSLIPLVDEFLETHQDLNKTDFIKEIYAFRESAITTHAEANALENIKEYSKDLVGGHAIVPFYPCENCAAKITNTLINQNANMNKDNNFFIVIDPNFKGNSPSEQANWLDSIKRANETFDTNNVKLVNYVQGGNIIKFVQLANVLQEEKTKTIDIQK